MTSPGAGQEGGPARARSAVAWIALYLGLAAALQAWTTVPWDSDTSYHLAVARLLRDHGLLHAFPWTSESWLARHYADKELLFHLLLVPLAGLDWVLAARSAGAVLGGAFLAAPYLILRREGVRLAGLWPLVMVASSGYFVMRLASVRPHLLAVPLALLVLWAAARRRLGWLALASAAFPFVHVAWHVAAALALVAEAARAVSGRRPDWRPPAASLAGLAAGLLLHPDFPAILGIWKLVTWDVLLRGAWLGQPLVALGGELTPFDLAGFLRHALLPVLLLVAALALALRRRREDPLPVAFALAGACWLLLTLGSQRFVEYLAPFSAVALALAARGAARRLAPVALGAGLLFTGLLGLGPIELLARRSRDFAPETEAALRAAVPAGAQVFTCGWITTGEMMLALPERRFLVALDPTLFYREDPERYLRWWQLVHAPPPGLAAAVRDEFGARFVLCERGLAENQRFLAALGEDPEARWLVLDPLWALAELRPAAR